MVSVIATSREFRERQREYLDIAFEKKRRVFIRRGKNMFLISPIDTEADTSIELNPEIVKKVEQAEIDYKSGNFIRLDNPNDLWNSLNKM